LRKFVSLSAFGFEVASALGLPFYAVSTTITLRAQGIITMANQSLLVVLVPWSICIILMRNRRYAHYYFVCEAMAHLGLAFVYGSFATTLGDLANLKTSVDLSLAKVKTIKPSNMAEFTQLATAHFGLFILVLATSMRAPPRQEN
jgi:hypothetical protein